MGRKTPWTLNKYHRYLKEGLGQGEGKDYKPWKKVSDFSSKQTINRIPGIKTNRIHLLSTLEYQHFLLLDWDDSIIDIREHFPILNLIEVLAIADNLNVQYPRDRVTQVPKILTSSFCITKMVEGKRKTIIRTVRHSNTLKIRWKLILLEIERVYYKRLGIDWAILTEQNIPKQLVDNLQELYTHKELEDLHEFDIKKDQLIIMSQRLKSNLLKEKMSLLDMSIGLGNEFGVESGVFLYLFKHLLASKQLKINLNEPIDKRTSLLGKLSE
ncbi:TnsA endonuclease C-terminal domain-containing protein [Neobacillus massiliamazoniensis]|uniref:Tn7-like transposition protein A n=1 Tax=Neobacillus massiliamazoniensis TaxID=1499688 RepID=A0A0U1P4R8_9BACI|nr:TnsA endonuclease C-terminal domain-containing protein [Neobacillus massiliamazoniensis]CRK85237.1 Tn7-like transposition protein A [Neobacillus massiliamazoniensis]